MELQVNISLKEANLVRGNYSYLGLVLIDKEYISIPNTEPFKLAHYLVPLVIPLTATVIKVL